jgi:hypothetical protein
MFSSWFQETADHIGASEFPENTRTINDNDGIFRFAPFSG